MSETATSSARLGAMLSSLRSRLFAMDGRLPVLTVIVRHSFSLPDTHKHAQIARELDRAVPLQVSSQPDIVSSSAALRPFGNG
jgi:hypothetical protein